jgi:Amt family ammonium transporter
LIQAGAAGTVIVWDALVTFVILRVLGIFMKLRLPDEVLETGDIGAHDEEAYPDETIVTGRRIGAVATTRAEADSRSADPVDD